MDPLGTVMAPVPGNTALSTMYTVGLPPTPVPLVTPIWLAVPVMVDEDIVPLVLKVTRPLKLALAKLKTCPLRAKVGLPPVPSALETAKPVPETAIERETTVEAESFTIMPPAALSRLKAAPVRLTWKNEPAPPSLIDKPVPAVT